ncbi:transposase [uncultured Tateyamaria sp.]|uniref:transposase n=1 Tax=uncultured Tateyamaria sp. TaxID=455651 RepID=UPI003419D050
MTASAILATVDNAKQVKNGRQLAAWLGLTPVSFSSGGKERLGRIMKQVDRYIRRLLVAGMSARLRQMKVTPP